MQVSLSTFVQALTKEGFIGSQILTLDSSGPRSIILSNWIREHEGIYFQCPSKEAP